MKVNLLTCRRFQSLVNASRERELNSREEAFLARHRSGCPDCEDWEDSLQGSMAFLRNAILDPEPLDEDFTWRVARRSRVVRQRDSLLYWSPAFLGAGVACLVLIAALQLAARSNPISPAGATAQRKIQHGAQAARGSYFGTERNRLSSTDSGVSEEPAAADGPLLLVRPKPTRLIDLEP